MLPQNCLDIWIMYIFTSLCYSDLHHSGGTGLFTKCCHPPPPQSRILPHCHAVLLLPSGTPAQEDLRAPQAPLRHLVLGELSDGPLGWSFHQKLWTVTQPTTSTCSPGVEPYRKDDANPKAFILISAYTQHRSLPLVSNSISFCLFVFFLLFFNGKHSQYGQINCIFLSDCAVTV